MKSLERFISRAFLFVIISAAVGCIPAQPTPTEVFPTSAPLSTATIVVPTSTPKASATPTSSVIVDVPVEKKCLILEENIPEDLGLRGVWIRNQEQPYLENLETQVNYGIPLYESSILSTYQNHISPDGKWLAYIDTYFDPLTHKSISQILRVINSAGHSLDMSYWKVDWQSIIGWMDDQHLTLEIYGSKTEIVSLNPFTGEWQKIQGLDEYRIGPYLDTSKINPTLDGIVTKLGNDVVLKDVITGKIGWQKKNRGDYYPYVSWSQDGSTVAISVGYALYIVRDSQELANLYWRKLNAFETGDDSIYYLGWSPDAHKFLIRAGNQLLVLDTTLPKITDFCFSDPNIEYSYSTPFWSPDNRFVITDAVTWMPSYQSYDILLDVDQAHVYKLPTSQSSQYGKDYLGWLAAP